MSEGRDVVLQTLHQAASQNPQDFKAAETQLEIWQTSPGFYATLVEIFSEHSLEVNVRWQAVLYFKNGVDRYWRKTAPKAITEEEKTRIRRGLMQCFSEPVPQIGLQLAVLISKLARVDYPREWPELLPTLFEGVKAQNEIVRHRTLMTLHHVVKQLSSKRLAGDRRIFQELTSHMFGYLLELWQSQMEEFLAADVSQYPAFMPYLERSHLALKILRKLVIYGFPNPEEHSNVMAFMRSIFTRIGDVLHFRCRVEAIEVVRTVTEKYSVLLTKILLELLESSPMSFVPLIRSSVDLALQLAFSPAAVERRLVFPRLTVQCMNLVRGIVMSPEYKSSKDTTVTNEKEAAFTKSVLENMCGHLISHYFPLGSEELHMWDADPEGFLEAEGGESWRYNVRPCAEGLFIALFHEYRQLLIPALSTLLEASTSGALPDPSDFLTIQSKDTLYNAIGLSAFDLYDDIDFDRLFSETLVREMQICAPNYRVLRRRAVWLVGRWIGVKFSEPNRPTLYAAIERLLAPTEDFVVRMSAAATLKSAIDDFDFNAGQFEPFLPAAVELLFTLLRDARECDTKMQVLHVMSFMIEMVGEGIRPHAAPLVHYLLTLWDISLDHNMLRCAILCTFVHIVSGLVEESEKLHPCLLPIIRLSTDVNQSCHVYLLEDGLELWLTAVENCRTPSDDMLALYRNMSPLLEYTSENLSLCLQITNAYILLCPQDFLVRYGSSLVSQIRYLMTDLKSQALELVLKTVEMMLRVLPQDSAVLLQPLLPSLIQTLVSDNLYPMMLSMYLSVVARLLLYTEDAVADAVTKAAEFSGSRRENVLIKLLDTWCEKMSLVCSEERRKLCALGLAHLCGCHWPEVKSLWGKAVTAVAEVIFDITLEDSITDKLVQAFDDYCDVDCDDARSTISRMNRATEHAQRLRKLTERDPVHTVILRSLLGSRLHDFEARVGSAEASEHVLTLEDDCKRLLREIAGAEVTATMVKA